MTSEGQAAAADLVGIPESRAGILTMLDYASLMRGLELLPHRRVDVLGAFDLDEKQGQPEIDRWKHWLSAHPSDEAECAHMAERMTSYWHRWDESNPERSERAGAEEEPVPDPANASLALMAKLSAGLEMLPDRRVEVFVAIGAHTHDEHVDLQIALDRLVSGPELDLRRFLALRNEAALFWQLWLSPPMLSLVDYARLVLDLERAPPKETANVHRAHRLDRVTAERELSLWKKLLADSVDERVRYEQMREQLLRPVVPSTREAAPPVARDANQAPQTARAVTGSIFTRTPVIATPAVATAPTMPFVSPQSSAQPPPASETGIEDSPARQKLRSNLLREPGRQDGATILWSRLEPPPIGLLEYTVLCLQLELDEARGELHYRRLGLIDQSRRDHVHAYWQNRFAVDPAARKEWIDQARRLRTNWEGSRK